MVLKESVRKELFDSLLIEKMGIQTLMSFFQNPMDISESDINEYLKLEDSIINTLKSVSNILQYEFYKG